MGYISRNGTLPVLSEAAFKLKVGEVSDVVETPYGYHILKVTDKRPAGEVTLAEVKPQISILLHQQKEREAFNAYLARLKAGAKIEILSPDTLTSAARRRDTARARPGGARWRRER